MSLDKIKKLIDEMNEATLDQTLSTFDIDKFVVYYINNLTKEYGDLPEQLKEHVAEEIEADEDLSTEFEELVGYPIYDWDWSSDSTNKFKSSELLKKVIKHYIQNALDVSIPKLKSLPNPITIYRIQKYDLPNYLFRHKGKRRRIGVVPEDTYVEHLAKFGGRLGIYWTSEQDWSILADSLGDFDGVLSEDDHLLETQIDTKYINWYETLYQRVHPEYGDWQEWKPESEIRLFKNTPIKLKAVSKFVTEDEEGNYVGDFVPLDITSIKNKTFYA